MCCYGRLESSGLPLVIIPAFLAMRCVEIEGGDFGPHWLDPDNAFLQLFLRRYTVPL